MARLSRGITFTPPTTITAAKLHQLVDGAQLTPIGPVDFSPLNVEGVDTVPSLHRLGYTPLNAAKGTHSHSTDEDTDAVQLTADGVADGSITEAKLANGAFILKNGGTDQLAPTVGSVLSFHPDSLDPVYAADGVTRIDNPTLNNDDFILRLTQNQIYTFKVADFPTFDHLKINIVPDYTIGSLFYDVNHDDTFPSIVVNATIPIADIAAGLLKFAPVTDIVSVVTSFQFRVSNDTGLSYGVPDIVTLVVTPRDQFVQTNSTIAGAMLAVDSAQKGSMVFTASPSDLSVAKFVSGGLQEVSFYIANPPYDVNGIWHNVYVFTLLVTGTVFKSSLATAGPSLCALDVNGPIDLSAFGYSVESSDPNTPNAFYPILNLISDASDPAVTDFSQVASNSTVDTSVQFSATITGAVTPDRTLLGTPIFGDGNAHPGTLQFRFTKHSPDTNVLDNINIDSIWLFVSVQKVNDGFPV
jgi:hypothetical protein